MSQIVLPYVYKITNIHTNQFYIGFRSANKVQADLDLGFKYFTSSSYVKELGFKNFKIDWIEEFEDHKIAYKFEQLIIFESFKDPLCLNKKCHFGKERWSTAGIPTNKGRRHSEEAKIRMSLSQKGKIVSEEAKIKMSISSKERLKNKENHPLFGKKGKDNPKFGKKCPKQSIAMKDKINGDKNPFYGKGRTIWINNGKINIRLEKYKEIPLGFIKGRIISWDNKIKGDKTSGFGSKWITNGIDNIKIYPEDAKRNFIPDGYYLGRTIKPKI